MSENEEKLLQAIHSELRETNNVLSGISGFIWNFVFWGFSAGLFFVLDSFFEPAFFFTFAGLLALIGLVLSLSALKFRWSFKSLWDSEPEPRPEREASPQEKPLRKPSRGEYGLIVAFLLAVAIGGLGLLIFL